MNIPKSVLERKELARRLPRVRLCRNAVLYKVTVSLKLSCVFSGISVGIDVLSAVRTKESEVASSVHSASYGVSSLSLIVTVPLLITARNKSTNASAPADAVLK